MLEVDSATNWGLATQYINKGPVGYVVQTYEVWTPEIAVSYSVDSLKGVIERNPKHHKGGGSELLVSPLSLLRCMDALPADEIKWSGDAHKLVAEFVTVTGEMRPRTRHWTVTWDSAGESLEVAAGWTERERITQQFTEWKALPGNTRWPMVDEVKYGSSPGSLRKRVTCTSVTLLASTTAAPTPRYPQGVVLFDVANAVYLDEKLQVVAKGEASGTPTGSASATGGGGRESSGGLGWITLACATVGGAAIGILGYRRLRT